MSLVTVRARLLRWGNSYGLRLSRRDVDRLRLRPESTIEVKVDVTPGERITAHELPSFPLGGDAADRHDELFAEGVIAELEEREEDSDAGR